MGTNINYPDGFNDDILEQILADVDCDTCKWNYCASIYTRDDKYVETIDYCTVMQLPVFDYTPCSEYERYEDD